MSLTKEQYLDYLEEEAEFYAEGYEAIKKLINEHFELVENFKQLEKNYDDLYDKKENTISFKYFHLLADSTLKLWGKEALLEYIHILYRNWRNTDYDYNCVTNFADELLDEIKHLQTNPPLKFEELKPDMWVWDKRDNKYVRICRTRIYEYDTGCFYKGQKLLRIYCDSGWYDTEFIENRFYKREVK